MVHIRGRVSLDKTVRSMPALGIVWSEEASRSLLELDQELRVRLRVVVGDKDGRIAYVVHRRVVHFKHRRIEDDGLAVGDCAGFVVRVVTARRVAVVACAARVIA